MKKVFLCLALVSALICPVVHASNVDFSVGINIGNQPRVAVPAMPVPVAPPPPPVYVGPPVVIDEPPEFIAPPELGFYAAVGVPYDLFFVGSRYYLYRGNGWYAAPNYNGPWVSVRYRSLPWSLRRHPYEKVRYYREAGYRHYREGRNPYWKNHHFHPDKRWQDDRREGRGDWKGDRGRHEDRGYRGDGRHHGKHDG